MKHLFSIVIVIGIVGLLVVPGPAKGPRHSSGALSSHDEGKQFVTINFVHKTQYDVPLWPDPFCPRCPNSDPCVEYIPGLDQLCNIVHVPAAELTGDVLGDNVLLSDVFCVSSDFKSARVEAAGYITGTLVNPGEEIYMMGRMVLNIDPASGYMRGRWIFDEAFGTHHGELRVEGTTSVEDGFYVGRGTYRGWIRENR